MFTVCADPYIFVLAMRTSIDMDDALLAEAMKALGLSTKKATIEEALRRLLREHRQKNAIADMAGLGWDGDLDTIRLDRTRKPRRFLGVDRSPARGGAKLRRE